VQTALLGRYEGTVALAAFGAVSITSGFATRVFNFLVDGVSAKTGKSVGMRAWKDLGTKVKMSLLFSLASGCAAFFVLLCIQKPIMVNILNLSGGLLKEAEDYWMLRLLLVPILLLSMSISGILQGFRHVHVVAYLNSGQAIVEMIGSAIVVTQNIHFQGYSTLMSMGVVTVVSYMLSVVAGFICMFTLRPPEADESFSLWNEVFSKRKNREAGGLASPLLETMEQNGVNGHHPNRQDFEDNRDQEDKTDDDEEQEQTESLLDFVSDGMNMLVRSMTMQTTFFIALTCASRLGQENLAAHSIINQLWILISYVVDGFAAAGIVLGSRLAAQAHDVATAPDAKKHLKLLIFRSLSAGLFCGILSGTIFFFGRDAIIDSFTESKETADILRAGTWNLLVLIQPINSLVFVYDGLMMASQSFVFIRNYFLVGFVLIFLPVIGLQITIWQSLCAVWFSKALFNIWRCVGAAYLIHFIFMAEFDSMSRHNTCEDLEAIE